MKTQKHIISASRRTDIPAFFAEWFEHQLNRNYCEYHNPIIPSKRYKASLAPEKVEGFVFWTRWPLPFLKVLKTLEKNGYPFYFHFTINVYPSYLEPKSPSITDAISGLKQLTDLIGKSRIIWRYDPIIITPELTIQWHKNNFLNIFRQINSNISLIITSIIDFYSFNKKTLIKLKTEENKKPYFELLYWMKEQAQSYGIQLQSCAEDLPPELGIISGGCVDEIFLARSNYRTIPDKVLPLHKLRKNCLCHKSIDIGANNTCKFGCLYCYANNPNFLTKKQISHFLI